VERHQGEGWKGAEVTAVMPFVLVDVPQRTDEWFAARLARFTSSMADKVFTSGVEVKLLEGRAKGSESVQKRNLRIRLACEYLTGISQENAEAGTAAMLRGVAKEDDARMAYEALSGRIVQQVGFLAHPELMAGASLDGYIGEFEGIVEIKCPDTATHLGYLYGLKRDPRWLPLDYMPQIRHELWISGAQYCDFVSYDDRMPKKLQLMVRRISREEVDLAAHELAVRFFLGEVAKEIQAILELAA
jgi:hypothetical protein